MTANAQLFTALADSTRREILERVAERPQSVGELAATLPVSRPAVSQHLKVLRSAGLVRVHADGTKRIYTIESSGVEELRRYLDRFWNHTLAADKEAVASTPEEHQE